MSDTVPDAEHMLAREGKVWVATVVTSKGYIATLIIGLGMVANGVGLFGLGNGLSGVYAPLETLMGARGWGALMIGLGTLQVCLLPVPFCHAVRALRALALFANFIVWALLTACLFRAQPFDLGHGAMGVCAALTWWAAWHAGMPPSAADYGER